MHNKFPRLQAIPSLNKSSEKCSKPQSRHAYVWRKQISYSRLSTHRVWPGRLSFGNASYRKNHANAVVIEVANLEQGQPCDPFCIHIRKRINKRRKQPFGLKNDEVLPRFVNKKARYRDTTNSTTSSRLYDTSWTNCRTSGRNENVALLPWALISAIDECGSM